VAKKTTTPAEPSGELTKTMSDEEILAAINAERAANAAKSRAANGGISVSETFDSLVALVRSVARTTGRDQRLSEGGAIKLLELSLGWTLQNRNSGPSYPMQEIGGEIEESSPADEALGFDTEADEETAA